MIIISDTSPLSALAEMGELEILRCLYGRVTIPASVFRECQHPHCPVALIAAFEQPDPMFEIVPDPVLLPETATVDPGEAAAISLAWQHRANALLIIDDRDGRDLCESLGLRKTGTAGVLFDAAAAGIVDFDIAMTKLRQTGFRISESVVLELRSRLPVQET